MQRSANLGDTRPWDFTEGFSCAEPELQAVICHCIQPADEDFPMIAHLDGADPATAELIILCVNHAGDMIDEILKLEAENKALLNRLKVYEKATK